MTRYVPIVPRFAPDHAARLEAFRREHEPARAALVPPHVTLVFGVRSIDDARLTALAHDVAASRAPFDVELADAAVDRDVATGEFKLLLGVGDGGPALRTMHDALYAGPLAAERRGDVAFRPHVTVATNVAPEPVERAARDAGRLGLPIRGRVEALEVFALEGGALRRIARAPLRSGATGAT